MFYDERIESVKGKTAKKCILMAVIVAFIIGTLRILNVLKNGYSKSNIWFVSIEIAIILLGIICLVVGYILKKKIGNDERGLFEELKFYNKAFPIILIILFTLFSIIFPISIYNNHLIDRMPDTMFGFIFIILIFTDGIYAIYSFKKEDIYFNYSFIDSNSYYKCVLKKIRKLTLSILIMFFISFFISLFLMIYKNLKIDFMLHIFLNIIIAYILMCFIASIIYLIYSCLEKDSYESKSFVSKASIISLLITTVLHLLWSLFVININRLPISQANTLMIISSVGSIVSLYIIFTLMIFLTYFSYEYLKNKTSNGVSLACKIILLSQVLAFFIDSVLDVVKCILIPDILNNGTNLILSNVYSYMDLFFNITTIIGISLLIIYLIKDKTIHKMNFISIILLVIFIGIRIFLNTQINYVNVYVYKLIGEFIILMYLSIIVIYIGKKPYENEML